MGRTADLADLCNPRRLNVGWPDTQKRVGPERAGPASMAGPFVLRPQQDLAGAAGHLGRVHRLGGIGQIKDPADGQG